MSSRLRTIARPYAKAVFAFAIEQHTVKPWQSMLTLSANVSRNEQIAKLLSSAVAPKRLADTFIAICGDQLSFAGHNLIRVMAENRRLAVLPNVLEQFIELRISQESMMVIEAISTYSLSEKQVTKVITAMEQRLSCKVKLTCQIDKSIVAGIIIRAGDMVIDGSIRGRLERFSSILQF